MILQIESDMSRLKRYGVYFAGEKKEVEEDEEGEVEYPGWKLSNSFIMKKNWINAIIF